MSCASSRLHFRRQRDNKGAVLKGFMMGKSAAIVSATASLKILPSAMRSMLQRLSWVAIRPNPEHP